MKALKPFTLIISTAGLIITSCAPASSPASSSATPHTTTDLCEHTVRAYSPLRDHGPAQDYGSLFTQDAEFHFGGAVTTGRDALIARHIAANAANRYSHFMQDVQINPADDPIKGETRFILYIGDKDTSNTAIQREIIGRYMDTFTLEAGQCLIRSRHVEIIFDRVADAPNANTP